MTSYTLQVQPQTQYTIEYSNQRGPQGATGAAGAATTDASLLVSGTLSDARLSANVLLAGASYGQLATIPSGTLLCNALGVDAVAQASSSSVVRSLLGLATSSNVTFAGLTLSGLQSFTGTTTPGLQLKSLTTAQITTLEGASALPVGSILVDSTTDRIDARLSRGTVELIDSAGGQVVAGNLAATTLMVGGASGPLFRNNSGTIEARNNANSAGAPFGCTNLTASGTGSFAGALTVTSYVYSDRITTPSFVLNSNGSNYGQIYRKDTTRWGLGYGASLGVTGSDSLLWGTTGVDVTGNLTASGTLRVGGGTVVANILSATATLDFPSIGSNGTETLTITVTGAVAGDSVFLGCPAGLDAGLVFCASVTAADTVTVRMHNSSGGSVDPASGTFRATVIRF
jgi:hypothetical protein